MKYLIEERYWGLITVSQNKEQDPYLQKTLNFKQSFFRKYMSEIVMDMSWQQIFILYNLHHDTSVDWQSRLQSMSVYQAIALRKLQTIK